MIDQSLGKTHFAGKDGFKWWIGQIAPPKVWRDINFYLAGEGEKHNRVKVRIIGYHPFDPKGTILPDEDLPWAEVMANGFDGDGQAGLGRSLTLAGGEVCVGFFLDGDDAQQPVIMGLLSKPANVEPQIWNDEIDTVSSSGFVPFQADLHGSSRKRHNSHKTKKGEEINNVPKKYEQDSSASKVEKDTSKKTPKWTPCNDTTVGKMTQAITDFIALLGELENVGDAWISPFTNSIVNMQAELAFVTGQVSSIMKSTLDSVKTNLLKNLNKKFKKLLGPIKAGAKGVDSFFEELKLKKGFKGAMQLIYCAFEGILGKMTNFISNMFQNLLGKVINGALCAIEQFTAGIFAKMFDMLEGALGKIMSGLNWLLGGLSSVKGVLRSVSGLAKKIFDFIGCNADKCATPSEWVSYQGQKLMPPDDYGGLLKGVDAIGSLRTPLANAASSINTGIQNFTDRIFSSAEVRAYADDNGITIAEAENLLAGGFNETVIDGSGVGETSLVSAGTTAGSIERAIDQISLFGAGNNQFDVCNKKNDNPTSQEDIVPRAPGYIYPMCIPPTYQVIGSGQGAELFIVVGNSRRIFSIEVINGGSGYDENNTSITIIDNTGNGHGADVKPIIKDGVITEVVILSSGSGYCLNDAPNVGVGTNVVGVITSTYIVSPGINYDPNDSIVLQDGTNIPIVTSPSGSIGIVELPPNLLTEYTSAPILTVKTRTGSGADIIPVMSFKGQLPTDVGGEERKKTPLIGITSVVDCIGDNKEFVGYVDGIAYSGPYHVMSDGRKMTGATHGETDSIIYDTIEESLGKYVPPTSYTSTTQETPETETPTQTNTITTSIVVEEDTTTTTTSSSTMNTDTTTSTPPPSDPTPPSDPPSGGGYGGGY